MDWVRAAQAAIAPNDSVERFTGLGVDVLLGAGRLKSPHEVDVNGTTVWGRHVVVATGSRPRVPRVPGLAEAGYQTNESVFDLRALPKRLLVMGGGPIGLRARPGVPRLGSEVTIVSSTALSARRRTPTFRRSRGGPARKGVVIHDAAMATGVAVRGGAKVVTVKRKDGTAFDVEADALLVATGRRPNVDGLGLEAAGVAFSEKES